MTDRNDPQRAFEALVVTGVKGDDGVWRVELAGLETGLTDDALIFLEVDQASPVRVIAESRSARDESRRNGTSANLHSTPGITSRQASRVSWDIGPASKASRGLASRRP